ncbi:PilZ domain-containing protein [Paenibacillus abyssi]|uniref:PilZ domain-containing protein n=1 Tax=Paenibacillus abyssi TaxID=1340531 RepID=UPI003617046E
MGRPIAEAYQGGADAAAAERTSESANTPPIGAERRRSARLAMEIPLMLSVYQWEQAGSFSGQTIEGKLLDLSDSGLQISSSIRLEKDMFVVIHFLQEAGLPPITARIIRIEQQDDIFHYGCMLTGLSPYQRLQLEQYIHSKLD